MTLISLLKVEKMDHSKMDHSKRYHDHGSILMGMAGNNQHKMIIKDFIKRFWISLILSVSVIIISPMIQEIFSYKKRILQVSMNKQIKYT